MSFAVKVQFKDRLYKMPPGLTSIKDIQQHMAKRFSADEVSLCYQYQGMKITDLTQLIQQLEQAGKKSIKIEARLEGDEPSRIYDSVLSSKISIPCERELREAHEVRYSLPKAFHMCYSC